VIPNTKALKAYKSLSQGHLNFVVLVCHAVPSLSADIALPNANWSQPPDHFNSAGNPKSRLAGYVASYQDELARSTLITVFSYFESYIKEALNEIVKFHGGEDAIKKLAKKRVVDSMQDTSSDIQDDKRKLQDNPTRTKLAKYQKYARLLDGKKFKFPTELFAHYGVSQLLPKLKDKDGMRAWEIPSILEQCLLLPLTPTEHTHLTEIRSLRNKVAHGGAPIIDLKKSLHYASILHTLAARVDKHITEHFLVIQAV
jgi:RiboL-PSP-HEPN